MSLPAIYNEEPHVSGTTWPGYVLEFREADGSPTDLTGATARMQHRDENGDVVFDWELGDGLEIPDPTSGDLFVTGPGVLSAAPGRLRYDLKVTLANGEVYVDISGTMPIVAGVTE